MTRARLPPRWHLSYLEGCHRHVDRGVVLRRQPYLRGAEGTTLRRTRTPMLRRCHTVVMLSSQRCDAPRGGSGTAQ